MDKGNRGSVKSTSKGYSAMIDASALWEEIDKLAASVVTPPEGWETAVQLGKRWGCEESTARRRADACVDQRVMVKERFRGQNGQPVWFYAPSRMARNRSKRRF